MSPQRIQMSRRKGWRKPEGAIYVGRPTQWGNPFKVGEKYGSINELARLYLFPLLAAVGGTTTLDRVPFTSVTLLAPKLAVEAYADYLINMPMLWLDLPELTGHDLACWCPLDQPCHADVLLELANADVAP